MQAITAILLLRLRLEEIIVLSLPTKFILKHDLGLAKIEQLGLANASIRGNL